VKRGERGEVGRVHYDEYIRMSTAAKRGERGEVGRVHYDEYIRRTGYINISSREID